MNIKNTLGISSQYDFEKGVMVDTKVDFALNSSKKKRKLQRIQPSHDGTVLLELKRFFKHEQAIEKNSKQSISFPDLNTKSRQRLFKYQVPTPGYYQISDGPTNKSLVNMNKQLTRRKYLPIGEVSNRNSLGNIRDSSLYRSQKSSLAEISSSRLQEFIQREVSNLQEKQKFQRQPIQIDNKKLQLNQALEKIKKLSTKRHHYM